MSEEWYYTVDGQRYGPVSGGKFLELARGGKIRPEDMVWKTGAAEWKPARKVKGLFPPAPSGGPPPLPITRASRVDPAVHDRSAVSSLDPVLAGVLSLLLPPLGQFLLGQRVKVIVLFLLAPVAIGLLALATLGAGIFILPIYNVLAALDAYLLARRAKAGASIGPWEFAVPAVGPLASVGGGDPGSPPGVRPALIGLTVASALPLLLSLWFILLVLVLSPDNLGELKGFLLCVTVAFNAVVIAALWIGLAHRSYRAVSAAGWAVAGSWAFLVPTPIPLGIPFMGTTLSVAATFWGYTVLRRPDVRTYFGEDGEGPDRRHRSAPAGGTAIGPAQAKPVTTSQGAFARLTRRYGTAPVAGGLAVAASMLAVACLVAVVGISLMAGGFGRNSGKANGGSSRPKLGPTTNEPGQEDAVSANDLADAYKNDRQAADALYKGRPIRITGVVGGTYTKDIGDSKDGLRHSTCYVLAGGRRLEVVCSRPVEDKDSLARLHKRAVLTGICEGQQDAPIGARDQRPNVYLRQCEVVSVAALSGDEAYSEGRETGIDVGNHHVSLFRENQTPAGATQSYKIALEVLKGREDTYAKVCKVYGADHINARRLEGYIDGLRETLRAGGIHR